MEETTHQVLHQQLQKKSDMSSSNIFQYTIVIFSIPFIKCSHFPFYSFTNNLTIAQTNPFDTNISEDTTTIFESPTKRIIVLSL
jgi:hypothetical protein